MKSRIQENWLTAIEEIKLKSSGHGISVRYQCKCGNSGVMNKSAFLKAKSCGCGKKRRLSNIVDKGPIGKLTVLSHFYKGPKNESWAHCRCECGNEKDVRTAALLSRPEAMKSCGCYNSNRMGSGESSKNSVIREYKKSARVKGLLFELSDIEVEKLIVQNCHYCGSAPSRVVKFRHCFGEFICNGIDRVDSRLGYVTENCVTCCTTCNYMKLDMNYQEFMSHIKRIIDHANG